MSRLRSSLVLLGICVGAILLGGLRLVTERTPLPVGSSYSTQPDGAQGLYDWAGAVGADALRVRDVALLGEAGAGRHAPATLLVLQPEAPLDPAARAAFDAVPQQSGTLVVAGDSLAWLLYVRSLGVNVEPVRDGPSTIGAPDGSLTIKLTYHYRLQADDATPLLIASNGDWVGLRMPYQQGALVVLATAEPLTNAGLRDEQTALFVYRQVVRSTLVSQGALAFDEAHHSFAPPTVGPTTLTQLAFDTPVGRASTYAAALVFVYLVLAGRRLGPPVPARPATQTRRTMYEHVQMLANLYRRAGQLSVVRAAFGRLYQRELARGVGPPKRAAAVAAALAGVETARTTVELIAAVAAAPDL